MLNFQVENEAGTSGVFTPDEIKSQLMGLGEAPKEISADGQYITLSDSKGDFQVKTDDILRQMGWAVKGIEPQDVLEDFVKPEFRVAVANLGSNDEVKKLYLKEKLGEMGLRDANIVGQGTDFYVFHPESNKYFALTNKRGIDMSDIASGVSQAPGFLGGAIGGMAGTIGGLGWGSVPAAIAGGAAGQALGDVGARGAIAAYDPTFRKMAFENLGEQAKDIGSNALLSGGTAGVFKALPLAAGVVRGAESQAPQLVKGALENGPVSSIARGLGRGTEEVGQAAATISKPFINPGMARDLATSQLPGTGTLQSVGLAFQAPGGFARWLTNMYGKFGGKSGQEFTKNLAKDEAGDLSLGRIFEKAGQTYGKNSKLGQQGREAYRAARKTGLEAEEALNAVRMERGAEFGAKARPVGEFLQKASAYGQRLENLAGEMTGGIAKGAYGTGRTMQGLGATLNRTARATAPLENRLYSKFGAEEYLRPGIEQSFDDYLRRRQKGLQSQQQQLVQNLGY